MTLKERLLKIAEYQKLNTAEFERKIGVANGYIKNFKGSLGSAKMENLLLAFPEVDPTWLLTGEGEMLKGTGTDAIPETREQTKGVPYIDVDFELGFDEMAVPTHSNPEDIIYLPGFERATFWCNAVGKSMEPEISSGDKIAMREIRDFSFLPFGGIYGIVTANGMRTIKRIGRGSDDMHYRLISTNPEYGDQEIDKRTIRAVFQVIGSIKFFS